MNGSNKRVLIILGIVIFLIVGFVYFKKKKQATPPQTTAPTAVIAQPCSCQAATTNVPVAQGPSTSSTTTTIVAPATPVAPVTAVVDTPTKVATFSDTLTDVAQPFLYRQVV